MSTTYLVQIDLQQRGNFGLPAVDRGLQTVSDKLIQNRRHADGLAESLIGGLGKAQQVAEGVVSTLFRIGAQGAMVGLAGGVALATYGVMGLNKELETTKISLGSIYTAQGITRDLPGGIDLASRNVTEMRRLAAKLPGEFEDLLNIMTTTAIPAFHAGIGEKQQLQLSSKLMAAGVVAKMPLDQVAREAAMLIEGRSGAHNVLGMRLMGLHGASATAYNQLSSEERMARLNAELDKYSGAIDTFSNTFEGVSSTALDSAKEWLRASTEPLFVRSRDMLGEINDWVDENDALLKSWADYIGSNLVGALDAAIDLGKEFGGVMVDGARGTVELVKEYGPLLKDLAKSGVGLGRELFGSPEALAAIAMLAGGAKTRTLGVAGLALAGTSSWTDPTSSSWWMRPLGAPDPSDFHTGRLSRLSFTQQEVLRRQRRDSTDGSVAGIDISGDGPKWRGRQLIVGKEESWMDQMFSFRSDRQSESWWLRPVDSDQMEQRERGLALLEINDRLEKFAVRMDSLYGVSATPASGEYSDVYDMTDLSKALGSEIDNATEAIAKDTRARLDSWESMSAAEQMWAELTGSGFDASMGLNDVALSAFQASFALRGAGEIAAAKVAEHAQDTANLFGLNLAQQALTAATAEEEKKKKEPKAPKGGTTIHKVEIVVTTNREPNRIARLVQERLQRLDRLSAAHAPRYDRGS